MAGRSSLSDMWGEEEGDEYDQQQIIDDYERMQRAQTQTIANFTPSPPRQPARGRGRAPAQQAPPPPNGEGTPFISLEARYRADYNRDMNNRRADWEDTDDGDEPEESSASERPSAGDEPSSESSSGSGSSDSESDSESPAERARVARPTAPRREERRDDPPPRRRRAHEATLYDTMDRPECFLCAWGNRFHDGIAHPHVAKLHAIIKESYGVHANREIARELHLYFKRHIFVPRSGMHMLTTACALEHIEQLHTLNARIFLGEMIRDEKMMYFAFKNAVWRQDGTWDRHAVKEYRESKKELRMLYMMPQARMNFSDGDTVEDQKRAAGYMHLLTRFDATGGGKKTGKKKVTSTPFRI